MILRPDFGEVDIRGESYSAVEISANRCNGEVTIRDDRYANVITLSVRQTAQLYSAVAEVLDDMKGYYLRSEALVFSARGRS